ncbi:CPBP family intramembrane metalloprotease domain-containing protein [Aliifodinibius salipaludis]|uniref:CPBP family intramembrane metalloprotease domain-containing protein n=1 Tax=Fodinibius salipaludis TaxID=2032627 RepID=A0A2A2G7Y7_9BACT|nr:type II CAAX endopeptidase family protein [Aliifodinibius salipaludis]PAU92965.1 CPBP family intramembrane metalloprotease domain-containing protein [Aliifodinibius salipaludis]
MNNNLSESGISNSNYQSWAERNGFSDWALALLWIIAAFILFQVTASIVAIALMLIEGGINADANQMMSQLTENLDLLFIGNSAGQILFLGLATWFFARLHSSREGRKKFLRFSIQPDTLRKSAITVVLIIAIQPTIWFLSWLNALIPVPEMFSNMQNTQMQMIENYLQGDHMLMLTLFHVALVPAICEETLYRGYVMRAFQKSWGIWPAIIVSGLLFGLYHIQLSNLIPLATLGMLFAYVTWVSESIVPAVVAHLVNNGGSVLVGTYYPKSAFAEITPESMPPLWAVIISLLITAYIVYWMYGQNKNSIA